MTELANGMAARLGNVIYWTCSGTAVLVTALGGGLTLLFPFLYGLDGIGHAAFLWALAEWFGVGVMLFLFGRATRYVLAGR